MKIMFIGAGVIGSYLYHVLCKNSREVTVLARGAGRRAGESACVSVSHIYGDGCRGGGLCNAGGAWVSCFAGGE